MNDRNTREREQPSLAELREQLEWLRAAYDYGAVSPAVYAVVRALEIEIAWRRHW
jgi:hypothetical protein